MSEVVKATQIRTGMLILHEGQPCKVTYFKHTVTGRGGACIPIKMKNIISGQLIEVTLRSDDKYTTTDIDERPMEFLYEDGGEYCFMDNETFDQISIHRDAIEEIVGYLTPNLQVKVQSYEGRVIGVTPPNTVQLHVAETEPSIKGATASGNVTKPATLETGLVVQVPMFISRDDVLIINTVSGEYQGRPGR